MHTEKHTKSNLSYDGAASNLILDTAITICRAQEAAKKQCSEMNSPTTEAVLAARQRRQSANIQFNQQPVTCLGCGSKSHSEADLIALHMSKPVATDAAKYYLALYT